MKLVDSGEGKVPIISVVAILAISLIVNLPGLAISPVLGKIKAEYPNSTALEVQLLNVLPNLLTIPFILGAGKICTPKNQLQVLVAGLSIFTATGVAYFFAKSMIVLILLGCLIGVGSGLVIPLAASLISQNFSGKPRGIILGAKSGLSNLSLIIATLFVGWVAMHNWHLSFLVYFLPILPLVLVPFIKDKFINQARRAPELAQADPNAPSQNFHFKGKPAKDMMVFALIIYFILTYGALVISYYLPFTMEAYGMSSGKVGVATSMFYLAATLAGFGLSKVIKFTGVWTFQFAMILIALSLFGIGFIHTYASYIIGVFLLGLGYGVIQPVLYDKTSYFAPTDAKSTEYFALLLTSSYVALSAIPFIVEFFGAFLKGSKDPSFPFVLNGVIMTILAIVVVVKHKNFVVQAGVIPQGKGIVEQPSSVMAPGVRYVSTSLQDNSRKVQANYESAFAESEAPVGVPMGVSAPTTSSAPASATPPSSSLPPTPTNEETTPVTTPAPAPIHTTGKSAAIMKAAETSLDEARMSLAAMRHQQALMLRQEAQELEEKAQELHREAQELNEEADSLEAMDETKQDEPKKNDNGDNPNAT
ncbi:MAG: MFS transporter [Muribaculaceae bacterium]|nr:MFS transporter [Muribaculaceae bacterium]